MKPGQTAIYYIAGESHERLAASPQLEGFRARGIEVILFTDPVDNFWVTTTLGYDKKPLQSVSRGDADLSAIPLKDAAATPRARGCRDSRLAGRRTQALPQRGDRRCRGVEAAGRQPSLPGRPRRWPRSRAGTVVVAAGSRDRNVAQPRDQPRPSSGAGASQGLPSRPTSPNSPIAPGCCSTAPASSTVNRHSRR